MTKTHNYVISHSWKAIVGSQMEIGHAVHVPNIETNKQRTIAVTEWAHCQCQVAFFLLLLLFCWMSDNEELCPEHSYENLLYSHMHT